MKCEITMAVTGGIKIDFLGKEVNEISDQTSPELSKFDVLCVVINALAIGLENDVAFLEDNKMQGYFAKAKDGEPYWIHITDGTDVRATQNAVMWGTYHEMLRGIGNGPVGLGNIEGGVSAPIATIASS